jgi:dCMP deaminase
MNDPHTFYLKLAKQIAEESRAQRLKVGAIIVKDNNIVSFGYNGTPKGFDNECEFKQETYTYVNKDGYVLVTKPEVLHAESNAIAKCAKSVHSSDGATLYTTHSPCFECCKLIIQSGITVVVFETDFRDRSGLELLDKAGIQHFKHEMK